MAFLIKLVFSVAAIAVASSLPTPRSSKDYQTQDSYVPQVSAEEPSYEAFALPSSLQLPRAESAQVPFYVPDLSTVLKAPQYSPEPTYYEVPIPAQDLVAPSEAVWNPDNDPKYYYEVPAILSQQDTPTNSYPKKFNKEIHSKSKPFSSVPKQEITLQPINEKEYNDKQKSLSKVVDKLAKKENQKQIQVQKGLNAREPQVAETGFVNGFDSEGVDRHRGFDRGLSADLTSSLGITSPHASSSDASSDRLEFHMVGHDGPHSYKWGYDTGKGHNRQFRYEERDKEGIVKGHFGFYDKHGKLQMVHYDSHPYEGFHAEGNFGKH